MNSVSSKPSHRWFALLGLITLFSLVPGSHLGAHEVTLLPLADHDLLPIVAAQDHVEAAPIDFGTLLVGHSVDETLTITNVDPERVVTVTPDPPPEFTVVPNSSMTLQPGESSQTLGLTFVAATEGPIPGLPFVVTHDDVSRAQTEVLEFSGSVVDPDPLVPPSVEFDDMLIHNSQTQQITVTNTSDWAADLVPRTLSSASRMSITPPSLTVPAGASATFDLTRDASDNAGPFSGSVEFDVTFDGVQGERVESVNYSGEVIAPAPLGGTTVDFGIVEPDTTYTLPITLTNPSAYDVTLTPLGSQASEVTVSPIQTVVLPAGGGTATFDVTLVTPAVGGTFTVQILFEALYDGLVGQLVPTFPVTWHVPPAELDLSMPEWGLYDLEDWPDPVNLGVVSVGGYDADSYPSFLMEITNPGAVAANGLDFDHGIASLETGQAESKTHNPTFRALYGDCGNSPLELTQPLIFCMKAIAIVNSEEVDIDFPSTLAPGETVLTRWTLIPKAAGTFDRSPLYSTSDPYVFSLFDFEVEVTPFGLVDGPFMFSDNQNTPAPGVGGGGLELGGTERVDGDDPLANFRPKSFDARTVFSVGEVDTVDLRAGNLTLVVPIGEATPVRGPLSYSLNAIYNSDMWNRRSMGTTSNEFEDISQAERQVKALAAEWPDLVNNLGAGWSLHLGRLLSPNDPDWGAIRNTGNCQPAGADNLFAFHKQLITGLEYVYVDPQGTQHRLYTGLHGDIPIAANDDFITQENSTYLYSRDGSYIRLWRESGTVRWIEEPNGVRRRFQKVADAPVGLPGSEWQLTEIRDRHDNTVEITYEADKWILKDNQGVSGWRTVTFNFTSGSGSLYPELLDTVVFEGFGDPTAPAYQTREYKFHFLPVTVGPTHRSKFHEFVKDLCGASWSDTVPKLTSIDLPDGTNWTFDYLSENSPEPNLVAGFRAEDVGLPTGGTIHYDYADVLDTGHGCNSNPNKAPNTGVIQRTVYDVGDTSGDPTADPLETTRYLRQIQRTDDIPTDYCETRPDPPNGGSSAVRPWSQQVVGVWKDVSTPVTKLPFYNNEPEMKKPESTVKLHYFNLWPFPDACGSLKTDGVNELCPVINGSRRLASGRSNRERNMMTNPADKKVFDIPGPIAPTTVSKSTETYSCSAAIDMSVPQLPFSTGASALGDDIFQKVIDDTCCPIGFEGCRGFEESFARYEVSESGYCTEFTNSPHCLRDSRLVEEITEYPADPYSGDNFRWVNRKDYDGLGHYRSETVLGIWREVILDTGFSFVETPESRTTYRNYNEWAGELVLDEDHHVEANITLPHELPAPDGPLPWVLNTYDEYWYDIGYEDQENDFRGGEACFNDLTGQMTGQRTWRCDPDGATCANPQTANDLSEIRRTDDLLVKYSFNVSGELTKEQRFGVNTGALSTTAACDAGTLAADTTIDYAYSAGIPSKKTVNGIGNDPGTDTESIVEFERTIDENTGWIQDNTLPSGETVTFDYDLMGRLTEAKSDEAASYTYDYVAPSGSLGWKLTMSTFPKNTTTGTPIRTYSSEHDGLGRLVKETLPTDDGANGSVDRTYDYDAGGRIAKVSSLDATNLYREAVFDYNGRPLALWFPDGSTKQFQHFGDRAIRTFTCVDKGDTDPPAQGICKDTNLRSTQTKTYVDFNRRPIAVRLNTGGSGIDLVTRFEYDPLYNRTRALRKNPNGDDQDRFWLYDGLGNMVSEQIPEIANVVGSAVTPAKTVFSNFDTRGSARAVTVENVSGSQTFRTSTLEIDGLGRTTELSVGNNAIKSFTYFSSGAGNGKVKVAKRWNHRQAADTLHEEDENGAYRITSTFAYDTAGRPNSRTTSVDWLVGSNSKPINTFTQGWTYDDDGNVKTLAYPNGNSQPANTVTLTYEKGFYLSKVESSLESTLGATLNYHDSGVLKEINHDGTNGTNPPVEFYGKDTFGVADGMPRFSSMKLGVKTTGVGVDLGAITYDWVGNIDSFGTETYAYDGLSRLLDAKVRGPGGTFEEYTYSYDYFDNRTDLGAAPVSVATNRIDDPAWSYDVFGNLKSRGGTTAVYDDLDKLVSIGDMSVRDISVYDHDDLRILRGKRGGTPSADEETWTLRDGLRVVREFSGRGGNLNLEADFVYAGSRRISSRRGGTYKHYHEDHLGNARYVSGLAPLQLFNGPFGEYIDPPSGERTVGFQGHETDGILTYMRGRSYYREFGRFLQVDPGRDASSWSLYGFAANNPVGHVDPTGYDSYVWTWAQNDEQVGHSAVGAQLRDSDGNPTGKVLIIHLWPLGGGMSSGGDYRPALINESDIAEFDGGEGRPADGIIQISGAAASDGIMLQTLKDKQAAKAPYHATDNNCANLSSCGLESIGIETGDGATVSTTVLGQRIENDNVKTPVSVHNAVRDSGDPRVRVLKELPPEKRDPNLHYEGDN